MGRLLVVVGLSTEGLFLWCSSCGLGWKSKPLRHIVDEVIPIEELAPEGFRVASRSEIKRSEWGNETIEAVMETDIVVSKGYPFFHPGYGDSA